MTMITPSYLGETIEYSSLHACRSTLEDPTAALALSRFSPEPAPNTAWQVAHVQGQARLGSLSAAPEMRLRRGQVLRTGPDAQLSLEAAEMGRMDISADSELLASTNRNVLLRRGTLHAFIWAPAREFVVDTPSARAVDLGCEYTVNVDGSGNGLLRVSMGWVAFQLGDHEAFIPAGAACVTHPREGPGIPYYEDAPEALRLAVTDFEHGERPALDWILAAARPRDGLTVWHLMTRVPVEDRGRVFDRFAQLERLPGEVSRDGVIRKDPRAIDLCWNALDLQNTSWWRGWERRWQ